MSVIDMKKATLINFIKYKMEMSGDSEKEIAKIVKKLKTMSYRALERYAIINDFIDGGVDE